MDRFLLDSSAILHVLGGTSKGSSIADFTRGGELATSVLCYCEVLNKYDLDKRAKAESLLSKLLIFPISLADGHKAVEFQHSCRKAGRQVASSDCLIAATAFNQDCTLITADSDFSRIDSVKKQVF